MRERYQIMMDLNYVLKKLKEDERKITFVKATIRETINGYEIGLTNGTIPKFERSYIRGLSDALKIIERFEEL